MSEARELLGKIVALRQRLEQVQGLAQEASTAAVTILQDQGPGLAQLWDLQEKTKQGDKHDRSLDDTLKAAQVPRSINKYCSCFTKTT